MIGASVPSKIVPRRSKFSPTLDLRVLRVEATSTRSYRCVFPNLYRWYLSAIQNQQERRNLLYFFGNNVDEILHKEKNSCLLHIRQATVVSINDQPIRSCLRDVWNRYRHTWGNHVAHSHCLQISDPTFVVPLGFGKDPWSIVHRETGTNIEWNHLKAIRPSRVVLTWMVRVADP